MKKILFSFCSAFFLIIFSSYAQDLNSNDSNLSIDSKQNNQIHPISNDKRDIADQTQISNLASFFRKHAYLDLGVSQSWDSNIFLDEDNEVDDFITGLTPSFTLYSPGFERYWEGRWNGDYRYYWDSEEVLTLNNFSTQGFFSPSEDVTVGARSNFEITNESTVTTLFGDQILQMGYWIFSAQPEIEIQATDRFIINSQYLFEKININESDLDNEIDRDSHSAGSQLQFELNPNQFLTAGLGIKNVSFQESEIKNSFSHLLSAGILQKFPCLLNIELKVIYDIKDFDSLEDDKNVDLLASATSTFSRYTLLFLSASKGLQDSSREEFAQYEGNRFLLGLQHNFTPRTSVFLKGSYEVQDYDPTYLLVDFLSGSQETKIYQGWIGIRHQLSPKLSIETSYRYQERDSDFIREDYQDHLVQTSIRTYF